MLGSKQNDVPLERRADGVNAIALMFKKRRLWRLNVWKWAFTYGRFCVCGRWEVGWLL